MHAPCLQRAVWREFRQQSGIKTCLQLLRTQSPPEYADEIRCLTTQLLRGLSRDPPAVQILMQMRVVPMLESLAIGPVHEPNLAAHERFVASAQSLIKRLAMVPRSGGPRSKQEVVNGTVIRHVIGLGRGPRWWPWQWR